jgi:hypothetical protein
VFLSYWKNTMARTETTYSTGKGKSNGNGTANLGSEQKLWLAADKLRGNMDASAGEDAGRAVRRVGSAGAEDSGQPEGAGIRRPV